MESTLFSFFISGEEKELSPGFGLWNLPLSGENPGINCKIPLENTNFDSFIKIGDYFAAACRFLSQNDFLTLKTGLLSHLDTPVSTDQIDNIVIFLEKHGPFYHPLKILVVLSRNRIVSFVLNGAVSRPGLTLVEKEYQLISGLNKTFSRHYLPRVFGSDFINTGEGRIGFFLGEWFDGYKEFHVTEDNNKRQVVIWNSDGSSHYISMVEVLPVYREISRILTCFYDIETFEQIFPWHHAAGDFVVRMDEQRPRVRLITVRGYSPLTEFNVRGKDKKELILPALLFFFLNLSLRIRLDRLNGTGRTVMLGKKVLKISVKGFLSGLDRKSRAYNFGDFRAAFIEFFCQFNLQQVMAIMENMLESWHPDPLEFAVIEENLESHCTLLYSIFKNL
ncbi:MAG: hypothetical protein GXP56_03325 [Deltaproteobacteria bacterium]|nr:hypothetical protein [Deltaproteobacteria bacterium]